MNSYVQSRRLQWIFMFFLAQLSLSCLLNSAFLIMFNRLYWLNCLGHAVMCALIKVNDIFCLRSEHILGTCILTLCHQRMVNLIQAPCLPNSTVCWVSRQLYINDATVLSLFHCIVLLSHDVLLQQSQAGVEPTISGMQYVGWWVKIECINRFEDSWYTCIVLVLSSRFPRSYYYVIIIMFVIYNIIIPVNSC